jgi:hypothetical protein
MLKLYYRIWVDAIAATKAKMAGTDSWKAYTLVPMSLLMGINLLTFFVWMHSLVSRRLPLVLPVTIFHYRLINDFISVVTTLFIPFVLLNYLLIFNNNRYEQLLTKYPPQNGKLYKKYTLISLGILAIPIMIVVFYFKEV